MSPEYLLTLGGLILISIVLAMALNLVQGYTGIMSVSHGASMGIGAYVTGVLTTTHAWDVGLALLLGMVVAGISGWLFMAAVAQLHPDNFILASFALQMAIVDLLLRWTPVTGGSTGLFGIPRPTLFGYTFQGAVPFFVLVLVVCGLTAWMLTYTGTSGYAIKLRAMRESHRSVAAVGRDVAKTSRATYAVSTAAAGLAGGLYAVALGIITPIDFDIERSIMILAFLLVGGLGNMVGAIIGATTLMVLPEVLKNIDSIPTQFQGPGEQILYGVLIVLFVWFRPQGILPERPILRLRPSPAADHPPRPTDQVDEVKAHAAAR